MTKAQKLDMASYSVTGSTNAYIQKEYNVTGTYRQALLKCRFLIERLYNQSNSMYGTAYLILNGKAVDGYKYDSNNGYSNREIVRLTSDDLDLFNDNLYSNINDEEDYDCAPFWSCR